MPKKTAPLPSVPLSDFLTLEACIEQVEQQEIKLKWTDVRDGFLRLYVSGLRMRLAENGLFVSHQKFGQNILDGLRPLGAKKFQKDVSFGPKGRSSIGIPWTADSTLNGEALLDLLNRIRVPNNTMVSARLYVDGHTLCALCIC